MCRLTNVTNRIRDAADRPEGVSFYLFGSILDGSLNSDIDLLCIYDARRISSKDIYGRLKPFFLALQGSSGSRVHPVILSEIEEQEVRFAETESCLLVTK
jgi:predicted nucleotidyltransferase